MWRAGRAYFCHIKYCVDSQVTLQEITLFNENVREKVEHKLPHFHMDLIAETNIKIEKYKDFTVKEPFTDEEKITPEAP